MLRSHPEPDPISERNPYLTLTSVLNVTLTLIPTLIFSPDPDPIQS